ncbi:MAG: hypothetical protein DMF71_00875 [Acidobacteria bacterium]|nr:MAG: hypothetical protein DMF71_00875 [Acidobacteriota bacterium]
MCSITTPRAAPQRATPLSKIKKIIPLASYLNAAYKKVRAAGKLGPDFGLKTHIPFSIFLEGVPGADYIYAGNSFEINGTVHHLDELECFSGSLIKVAAMFAAFTLRREADVLRTDMRDGIVNEPLSKFFDKLAERVNPTSDAVPEIMTAARIPKNNIPMVPSLRDILSITDLDTAVTFTADFRAHLRRMIIRSRDCDTAECIFRLSYPYINVKLMNEGYFHRDSMKGIWLCGDYFPNGGCAKEAQESKLQYKATGQEFVRIDTVNDCDQTKHPPFCGSAQNTTSKEMARLFLNILHEELVDPTSAHEMRLLLFEAQNGSPKDTPPPIFAREDFSFLEVDPRPDANDPLHSNRATGNVATKFTIEGVKIGQGEIKTDPDRGAIQVRSEGSIIKWNNITKDEPNFDPKLLKNFEDCNLTGQAAICWQNLSTSTPNTDGIIEIINDSISGFINQGPLTP